MTKKAHQNVPSAGLAAQQLAAAKRDRMMRAVAEFAGASGSNQPWVLAVEKASVAIKAGIANYQNEVQIDMHHLFPSPMSVEQFTLFANHLVAMGYYVPIPPRPRMAKLCRITFDAE